MYVCIHHSDSDGGNDGPENGGRKCVGMVKAGEVEERYEALWGSKRKSSQGRRESI